MRRLAVALFGCVLAGCSSSTPPPAGSASDAGSEYRALGQSCDPTSPHPCEVLTDGCSAAVCQARICVRVLVDAGPTCSNGSPPVVDGGEREQDASQAGDAASPDGGDGGGADATSDASVDASQDASDAAESDASFDASGD